MEVRKRGWAKTPEAATANQPALIAMRAHEELR